MTILEATTCGVLRTADPRRMKSARVSRMPGDFTICAATCGSGAEIRWRDTISMGEAVAPKWICALCAWAHWVVMMADPGK